MEAVLLKLNQTRLQQGDFCLEADFTLRTGSIAAILGPSGSGKSTLLNMIAGFLRPQNGEVLWKDWDLTPLLPKDRPVSVIFQDQNLFPHLTVTENVALGLKPSLKLTEEEKDQVAESLLNVGLKDYGSRYPAQLSGGQQSRVALARMVLRNQPLALLDEPFSALGPALKTEMLDLVCNLARHHKTTLLMVTHDPNDARRIASETILVENGHAHPPQETGALFANPPDHFRNYLGAG